jgi:DNA-binding NarL/FixJ family response regulator
MPSNTTLSKIARVLLVDDNEAMLNREAMVLASGCEVVGAVTDGEAALAAAQALDPDVIVLDISMPGISGLEVAARLRRSGSRAGLVFLTVHDEEEFVLAAKAVGGKGYVVKGRLVSDLLTAVREVQAGGSFVSSIR